jgi:hypothetical protein
VSCSVQFNIMLIVQREKEKSDINFGYLCGYVQMSIIKIHSRQHPTPKAQNVYLGCV